MSVWRALRIALAGVAPLAVLSGCAGVGACSTMHRSDGFPVVVAGASHPSLVLCVEGSCTSRIPDRNGAFAVVRHGREAVRVSRITAGHWYVVVTQGPDPASVDVALDGAGARTLPLAWHRSPQSDSCVAWRTVDTVRLTAP